MSTEIFNAMVTSASFDLLMVSKERRFWHRALVLRIEDLSRNRFHLDPIEVTSWSDQSRILIEPPRSVLRIDLQLMQGNGNEIELHEMLDSNRAYENGFEAGVKSVNKVLPQIVIERLFQRR